jgi:hypothetical protein
MSSSLEYPIFVRHSIPASSVLFRVVLFSLFLSSVFFVSSVHAQINGAPPTSAVIPPTSTVIPPSVGRSVNPPTGAASLGPRSFSPDSRGFASGFRVPFAESNVGRTGDRHPLHHHHDREFVPPLFYGAPVPYAVDSGQADDSADSSDDDEYQGGPTIFDRRGYGAASYVPPVRDVPTPHAAANVDAPVADPGPPQQPTVLVFKDGHKLEVGNYAIVGSTLFDLTPGHPRKIPLADLDLEATRQQNDDRGVAFQLPTAAQAN